jgi:hypothetical protein
MENLQQMFLDQFEEMEGRLVYRRYRKGAPIPVSAEERDRFVAEYRRRMRYLTWGFGALVAVWILVLSLFLMEREQDLPMWLMMAQLAPLLAVFVLVQRWVWDSPMRGLAGRLPVGGERSRAELKRIAMQQLTWPRIAGIALTALFPLIYIDRSRPLLSGDNLFWMVLMVLVIGAAGIAAVRKLLTR